MSRILHHVGRNDFKKTRQRQISENKERAAQKLKELQEVEAERKQIEEAARPYKSNWRRENLREFGEWAPIETSGPTNGTSTTFGYFAGGSPVINGETGQQVTFTYSGLNGVENYPTSIMVDQGFGDVMPVDPPPFSQVGVQGYTAKLNPRYAEAQKKYKKEYAEWEKQRDENFQKIKDTLKSFGTSFEELRASKKWVKKLGDGTFVALMPTAGNADVMNWTDNVRVVKLKQAANADPMYIDYNTKEIDPLTGKKRPWMAHNVEIQDDVYLGVGEPPKAPMEQQYLMPRRTDFKDVNPQLDASQEFAQQVGADELMNARVQDLTPLSKNPFGIDYGEIASTNLRGLLQDPNANYSTLRRGQISGFSGFLGKELYLRYATGRDDPYTERDMTPDQKELLRMHVQQLLDNPNSSRDGSAGRTSGLFAPPERIKTDITRDLTPYQRRVYGMNRGDRAYQMNSYVNREHPAFKDTPMVQNDLQTALGNFLAITNRRGKLKSVRDDFDFVYGNVRADAGLPGQIITKKKSGGEGIAPGQGILGAIPGYIEASSILVYGGEGSADEPKSAKLARAAVNAQRTFGGGGSPVPINIKFR